MEPFLTISTIVWSVLGAITFASITSQTYAINAPNYKVVILGVLCGPIIWFMSVVVLILMPFMWIYSKLEDWMRE